MKIFRFDNFFIIINKLLAKNIYVYANKNLAAINVDIF